MADRNGIPLIERRQIAPDPARPYVQAALVRIDQDKLEDWLLATVGDPSIGASPEKLPEGLRAAARPVAYGKRQIKGLTKAEADGFAEALAE